MRSSSKYWNEKLGYIHWMDSKYITLDSLDLAKEMIKVADDSITKVELDALIEKGECLNKRNLSELKRYIVEEYPRFYKTTEIESNRDLVWSDNYVKMITHHEKYDKEKNIMLVGFELKHIFEPDDNESRYYHVKVGDDEVIKTKDDLIKYIDSKRTYSIVHISLLKQCISAILYTEGLNKALKVEKIYPAIGVFADKNDNLVVCYPGVEGITLQGLNPFQKRIIKLCEKRDIDVKGELIKDYLKIMNFRVIPDGIMLLTLGYTISATFFHVLKDVLDLFPNFFWTAEPPGVGKTNHLEIFMNFLHGTELKSNDDVGSPARITLNATAHTSPLHMDDLDKMADQSMNFIKGNSTRKKGRERLTKDQDLNTNDTYTGFVGSGNSSEFLSGNKNNAFRNRCIINDEFNIINGTSKEANEFINLYTKLKTEKILGYYLLKESIQFVDNQIEGDLPTKMKLEQYYKEKRELIAKFINKNNICLENSRRTTIYTLLVIGWEFWEFALKSKGLECELLSEALDIHNNKVFIDLILKCEDKVSAISVAEFENIIEFYEKNNSDKESLKYFYEDTHKNIILTTTFIHDYDKWARERGYQTLNGLPALREIIVKLTQKQIEDKVYKVRNRRGLYQVDGPCKLPRRGVIFPLKEIKRKLGLDPNYEKSQKFEKEIRDIFTEDCNTVELSGAITVLELNDDFERDYIERRIKKLILKGTLSQTNGKITLL